MDEHGESSGAGRPVEIGAENHAIAHGDGDAGVDTDGRLGDKRDHHADGGEACGDNRSVCHERGMLLRSGAEHHEEAAEIYCSRGTTLPATVTAWSLSAAVMLSTRPFRSTRRLGST